MITDPLPEFLVFVSASDGGAYDPATGIITWELGDLMVDGSDSVSFVTTVDPAAPETDPIVNVATAGLTLVGKRLLSSPQDTRVCERAMAPTSASH